MQALLSSLSQDTGTFRNDKLVNFISSQRIQTVFNGRQTDFLPYGTFEIIAHKSIIDHVLRFDPSTMALNRGDLRDTILKNGSRLFTMALWNSVPMSNLGQVLDKYDDDTCPFDAASASTTALQNILRVLLNHQLIFRVPFFKFGSFQTVVDPAANTLVDRRGKLGSGANATVYGARVNGQQHNFMNGTGSNKRFSNDLALKVIKNETQASHERRFLELLMSHSTAHANILNFYGGYRSAGETFLFSELGDCNLNDYMEERFSVMPCKEPGPTLEWVMGELRGLAEAMSFIHNDIPEHNAFHHDIKPENIVMVTGEEGQPDRLKIMDWGCAEAMDPEKSDQPKSSAGSHCSKRMGNPPYNPPEYNAAGAVTSRPHDVWSLGCVFLDVLIWCRGGWKKLGKFRSEREGKKTRGYFERGPPVRVLDCVQEHINRLISDHDSSVRGLGNPVAKMLECDPSSRTKMADVVSDWPS